MRTTVVKRSIRMKVWKASLQSSAPPPPKRGQQAHTHPGKAGPMPTRPGSRNGRATSLITGQPSPHNRCRPTQTREFGDKGDLNPWTTPDPRPAQPRCGLKGARWHLGPVCHPFLGTGIFLIRSIRNVTTSCFHLPGWQGEGTASQVGSARLSKS